MTLGRISAELLLKIKEAVSIIEVIGEHVVLRKSGANFVGLCPFHSERSPSFSVSENKQLFHCYGCGKGGDLVTFVMEILGVSFPEAVEELADRAKVLLPKDWHGKNVDPGSQQKRNVQNEKLALAFKLNRFAAAFYHQGLGDSTRSSDYLQRRGVTPELIRSFYLGAASDSWDALSNHLVTKKAPLDLAQELGLIRPSVKKIRTDPGPGYFDLFRDRAIFPILNLRGKIAGFGGRSLGNETPKYLNSPESFIFQKGKLAFGLYQAQKHIREADEIILVEGYFDVLTLHAAGFRNVVATCGTALTLDHLSIFKRFANRIIVLFDGDKAGVSATERAMEVGLDQGWVLYGAQLPPNVDPDEMIWDPETGILREEGRIRMSEILKQSHSLLDLRIEEAIQFSRKGPDERTQALKRIMGWLGRFKDPVGQEVRFQNVQKRLEVSRSFLMDVLKKSASKIEKSKGPGLEGRVEVKTPQTFSIKKSILGVKIAKGDHILLMGIAWGGNFSKVFADVRDNLPPGFGLKHLFDYKPAQEFVTLLGSEPVLLEKLRSSPETILHDEMDPQVRSSLTEALLLNTPSLSLDEFRSVIFQKQAKSWARFSQQIKKAIGDAEARKDAVLQAQLMKEYLDVQRKMKEFSSFYDEE